MQVCLRLLDDQPAIGGVGVFGQLAEYYGHEDQVVEAQAILLYLESIHGQR
ncbi:hypothetical protein D9M71_780230 [compost metagenome]